MLGKWYHGADRGSVLSDEREIRMPDEQEKSLGDLLIQGLEEALAIGRGEKEPARVSSYPLPCLTEEETQRTGAELVAFWDREGVVGSRADIEDPAEHARALRERASRRE
jgi:hypothetical protein